MNLNFTPENIPEEWKVNFNSFYTIAPEDASNDEAQYFSEDLFQASNKRYLIDVGFYKPDSTFKLVLIRGDFNDGNVLELIISDSILLIIKRMEFYFSIDMGMIDKIKGLNMGEVKWNATISYLAQPNDYFVFLPLGWYLSNNDEANHLHNELKKELPENHLLSNKNVKVIAHRLGTDDILCQDLQDPNNFIVIHLTWSMETEIDSEHPYVEVNGNFEDFLHYERMFKI